MFQVAEQEWIVVIGDVTGKGVAAALVTAFVRHTIRDLAMRFSDPASCSTSSTGRSSSTTPNASARSSSSDSPTDGDAWSICGSVGGHPLPLVRHADGSVDELGKHGSLVGVITEPTFETFEHRLVDDLLVLYTDGVIEARRDRAFFGLEGLGSARRGDRARPGGRDGGGRRGGPRLPGRGRRATTSRS